MLYRMVARMTGNFHMAVLLSNLARNWTFINKQLREEDTAYPCPYTIPSVFIPMATTFYQFSKLPAELRYRIWEFAVLQPREVKIYHKQNDIEYLHYYETTESYFCSRTPWPPLFHVSRESRNVSQRHYIELFKGVKFSKIKFKLLEQGIYVNPNVDTICSTHDDILKSSKEDWTTIQVLKIMVVAMDLNLVLSLHRRFLPNIRRVEYWARKEHVANMVLELAVEERWRSRAIPLTVLYEQESRKFRFAVGPKDHDIEELIRYGQGMTLDELFVRR